MTTFKWYKDYKGFLIYKMDKYDAKEFMGFKFTEDKKNYEFRTKNYKTLKSVEKAIDLFLKTKKEF